jgi:hypothetical protein
MNAWLLLRRCLPTWNPPVGAVAAPGCSGTEAVSPAHLCSPVQCSSSNHDIAYCLPAPQAQTLYTKTSPQMDRQSLNLDKAASSKGRTGLRRLFARPCVLLDRALQRERRVARVEPSTEGVWLVVQARGLCRWRAVVGLPILREPLGLHKRAQMES